MKIILMRHGNAEKGLSDAARPLSAKGVREAEAAGKFLFSANEVPDIILHSPLQRSQETAEIVQKNLKADGLLRLNENLKPEDSPGTFLSNVLKEFAEYAESEYKIMAVGHNPFISDLAALLLWNSRCRLSFGTGTLLEAENKALDEAWDLCFYLRAGYLLRLFGSS